MNPDFIVFAFYVLAGILYIAGYFVKTRLWHFIASAVLIAGFLANTLSIVNRWLLTGHPPFQTRYESLVFYTWCFILSYLVLECPFRLRKIGAFAIVFSLIPFAYALSTPSETQVLPPALQSAWFVPHVVVYFIAYALLSLAFVASLVHIVQYYRGKPSEFNRLCHRLIWIGFPFLTMGLIFGALWGKRAWGDYWSWDVKETWALITWLTYLIYFHLRFRAGFMKIASSWFVVVGFVMIVITYLGVEYLPAARDSVHVYIRS